MDNIMFAILVVIYLVYVYDLKQLVIECNDENSCRSSTINLNQIKIYNTTIGCEKARSCGEMDVIVENIECNNILNIYCIEELSCQGLHAMISPSIYNISVAIFCYNIYSCDNLLINGNHSGIQLNMYEYSENIQIKTSSFHELDMNCGNKDDQRVIRYDTARSLNRKGFLAKARKEYNQRLPCEDIMVECNVNTSYDYVQESVMVYELNVDVWTQLETNEKGVGCYWIDLNDLYNITWQGSCGNDVIYYSYPIDLDINIRFDITKRDDLISKNYEICDQKFGTINDTMSTFNDINTNLEYLLSIATYYTRMHDVLKYPNTTFTSNDISYLECDSETRKEKYSLVAALKTSFVIGSVLNSSNEIDKDFGPNSPFHDNAVAVLNAYFNATVLITLINETVINITKENTVYIDGDDWTFFFSYSYTFYLLIAFLTLMVVCGGFIHHKLGCSKQIDVIKYPKIVAFSLQVLDIMTDIDFVY